MNTQKENLNPCVCDIRKKYNQPGLCAHCKRVLASFPDVLVERASELGLMVLEYDTVEALEKGIIAAERERDQRHGEE